MDRIAHLLSPAVCSLNVPNFLYIVSLSNNKPLFLYIEVHIEDFGGGLSLFFSVPKYFLKECELSRVER
ncbi:hypothetical protein Trydic_g10767 [Trypoxylus dichotomus]